MAVLVWEGRLLNEVNWTRSRRRVWEGRLLTEVNWTRSRRRSKVRRCMCMSRVITLL